MLLAEHIVKHASPVEQYTEQKRNRTETATLYWFLQRLLSYVAAFNFVSIVASSATVCPGLVCCSSVVVLFSGGVLRTDVPCG